MSIRPETIGDLGDFEHYQNKLKHFKKNATGEFQAVYDDDNIEDKVQALTENYLERIPDFYGEYVTRMAFCGPNVHRSLINKIK